MEDFFNFYTNLAISVSAEPQTTFRVTVITDLEKFKAANGEIRTNLIKEEKTQVNYTQDYAEAFVLIDDKEDTFSIQNLENAACEAVLLLKGNKLEAYDVAFDTELTAAQLGQFYFASCCTEYTFDNKPNSVTKRSINFVGVDQATIDSEDFQFFRIMADSKSTARDFCNGRINYMNTITISQTIQKWVRQHPEKVKMIKFVGDEVQTEGLNLVYNVGMGSKFPPTFINLRYNGNPDSDEYHGLVGKGVIFDTGGTDIKTVSLYWMFCDKGGGSAVYGAFKGIVEAGLKVNVTLSLPLAENSVDGAGYRTSDIIKSYSGKTVEILNTDAEGRLLLCDAMSWTQKNYKLASLIELSTLTGASKTAMGDKDGCLFSNDDELVKNLRKAGAEISENLFRLPYMDYITARLKSGSATLKNCSLSGDGGCIEAACYLREFVEDENLSYAHIDMSGPAKNITGVAGIYRGKGATGFGVGFLMQYFRNLVKAEAQN